MHKTSNADVWEKIQNKECSADYQVLQLVDNLFEIEYPDVAAEEDTNPALDEPEDRLKDGTSTQQVVRKKVDSDSQSTRRFGGKLMKQTNELSVDTATMLRQAASPEAGNQTNTPEKCTEMQPATELIPTELQTRLPVAQMETSVPIGRRRGLTSACMPLPRVFLQNSKDDVFNDFVPVIRRVKSDPFMHSWEYSAEELRLRTTSSSSCSLPPSSLDFISGRRSSSSLSTHSSFSESSRGEGEDSDLQETHSFFEEDGDTPSSSFSGICDVEVVFESGEDKEVNPVEEVAQRKKQKQNKKGKERARTGSGEAITSTYSKHKSLPSNFGIKQGTVSGTVDALVSALISKDVQGKHVFLL
jgi:hypothetical protein